MDNKQHTNEWTEQRYEYYIAGRTLWFNNQMKTAAIMLAYSIETHIKHQLSLQKGVPGTLLYDHTIIKLFNYARELQLFMDVQVSDDFLQYVQDTFHCRYPSQIRSTIKNAETRGHGLAMDPSIILAYDDFILQLDESIYRSLGSVNTSIAARAAKLVDSHDGRLFFHCNFPAFVRHEFIMQLHEESLAAFLRKENNEIKEINKRCHKDRVVILSDPSSLLHATVGLTRIRLAGEKHTWHGFAKAFRYPGIFYQDEDGSKTWESRPWRET